MAACDCGACRIKKMREEQRLERAKLARERQIREILSVPGSTFNAGSRRISTEHETNQAISQKQRLDAEFKAWRESEP